MADIATGDRWHYPDDGIGPDPGTDDTTYRLCAEWLAETCATIEDWGAGMGYARKFIPAGVTYTTVDWAPSAGADITADAAVRRPDPAPDGILLRHVLEHNDRWQAVLDNAVATFRRRLALVIFTPFAETTRRLTDQWPIDWSFRKDDLAARLGGMCVRDEHLDTCGIQYDSGEHVFLLERP